MCYSAQVIHEYGLFTREFGAVLSLKEFFDLYWHRRTDKKVKIPKAMDALFASPSNPEEQKIKTLIDDYAAQQAFEFEQELFKQRKRLADAERALQTKITKSALESKRIAGEKVEWLAGKLNDLRRTEPKERDGRIFPGHYAPVMIVEHGQRIIMPMRYQCRQAGKPAFYDAKYPGCYNARKDNLEGFWRGLFGRSHGLMLVTSFYENVERKRPDGTAQNVVLQFKPTPTHNMLVACLWSRWTAPGEPDLLSFAAITDEPPPEVAAAGHDRCIVPIRPENIDAWLTPDANDLAASYRILDDRDRPYYEHRLAA
jgi:putative SOS response-associated peptidase YedK